MSSGNRVRKGRRRFVATAAGAVALALRPARAQTRGALRFVVGFTPGGSSDRVARVLATEYAREFERSTVVENVPGANSARAIARVAAGEPPGDFLLLATSAIAHPDNAAAIEALQPVIMAATSPMVLIVAASSPVRDPYAFARYVKERPNLSYGSGGIGNVTHLCAAELMERLGVEAIHVPYQGAGPGMPDLLGGRIDFMWVGASAATPTQANVRVIAVSTASRSRLPGYETIPTISETIARGFDFSLWQGIWAPNAVPGAAVAALNAQFRTVLATPTVRAALADVASEVISGSPDDARRLFVAEAERFRKTLGR